MELARKLLIEEAARLPLTKIGKALSFIRFLDQEPDEELLLDPEEEAELREILASDDFISSDDVLTRLLKRRDDQV